MTDAFVELEKRQNKSLVYLLILAGQLANERGIARVNREAGREKLREAHTKLLPHLATPGGTSVSELAEKLGVTKQAIQPLVSDLIREKVLRSEKDPEDGRTKRLHLTKYGFSEIHRGTGILEEIETELAPAFTRDELKTLKKLLRRVLVALAAPPSLDLDFED